MSQEKTKEIPYGISDFKRIRTQNMYYVDKTEYIEKIEQTASFLFFVRPHCFGKSLFVDMLRYYYDCNEAANFDTYFSGLYIHEHPTELHNQFLVMHLDFSQISGRLDNIYESFNLYIYFTVNRFVDRYSHFFSEDFTNKIRQQTVGEDALNMLTAEAKDLSLRMYLIVDEYDNFTNNILNAIGEKEYIEITHGVRFYRDLFKKFKGNFERIFMIGVSPVTMDDLTSGYNIALNITLDYNFNEMFGFSETELRNFIEYYRSAGLISRQTDELIAEMRPWYDNYCFARRSLKNDSVFSPNMAIYYLHHLVRTGFPPENLLDPNIKTDYNKLKKLINIEATAQIRKGIINQIISEGQIRAQIVPSFPAEYICDEENFVSMLYYYGMLTMSGERGENLILSIPNRCVREQYYSYMRETYSEGGLIDLSGIKSGFDAMAEDGVAMPIFERLATSYKQNTSVRALMGGERSVQTYLLAYLSLTTYFITKTERELNHGFADIVLLPNIKKYDYLRHAYIIELKYIAKGDDTPALREAKYAEAKNQLAQYSNDKELSAFCVHKYIILAVGEEMIVEETE